MFPLLTNGVIDTSGWCCWYQWQFAPGIVDTGGNFTTGINNTSGTGGHNLPPVLLILVVHFDLQISRRIFEKKLKWP